MQNNNLLPEKYAQLGFHITRLDENTLSLKFLENTILVFNSKFELGDDFIDVVCESYYRLVSDGVKHGLKF
jgi:hypothetical protein